VAGFRGSFEVIYSLRVFLLLIDCCVRWRAYGCRAGTFELDGLKTSTNPGSKEGL